MTRHGLALKAAFRRLVERFGGYEQAAQATRVSSVMLHHYGNPSKPDTFAPIDVVFDLEHDCGEPHVTAWLAKNSTSKRPDPETPDPHGMLLRLAQEVGDVARVSEEVMVDKRITINEARQLTREWMDIVKLAEKAIHDLEHHEAEQLGGPDAH